MCLLTLCQVLYSSNRAKNKTDTHSCPQGEAHLHLSLNYHLRIEYFHLMHHVCMRAKSLQLCPTLCSSMDHSPAGSSVHGILQARTLEWVAVPPSKAGDLPSPGLVHHSPDHIIISLTLYLSFHILLWFSLRIPTGRSGWLRWGLSGQKGRERKRN